jgi:hypothetical protein
VANDSSDNNLNSQIENTVTAPQWSCELSHPTNKEITVGEKITLNCQGDYIEPLLSDETVISFDGIEKLVESYNGKPVGKETDLSAQYKYSLKILKVNNSEYEKAQFTVVSYKAGSFNTPFFLQSNNQKIEVKALEWQIKSVIEDPKEKMIPPFGPFKMSYPLALWLGLSLVLLLLLYYFYRVIYRRYERKIVIEKVKGSTRNSNSSTSPSSPYHQFHREARYLKRHYSVSETLKKKNNLLPINYLHELDEVFKNYLMREFLVPADKWSLSLILKDIKKRHRRVFRLNAIELKKVWLEFERLAKRQDDLTWEDLDLLYSMTAESVDKVNHTFNLRRKKL